MIKKDIYNSLLSFLMITLVLSGCTEEFIPETQEEDQRFVVEGFIEAGESETPTYILLTKSIPFLSTIDLNTFNSIFVNNAKVTVSDGTNIIELQEFCLDDLPPAIREAAATALGFDPDSTSLNICAYVDLLNLLNPEEGGVYDLKIEVEDEVITARTTIPESVPLFNLRWDDPPGEPSDTIARLWVTIDDPDNEANFYRYFTEQNDEGLVSPFSSVVDDKFFDGQEFEFPLTKAEPRDGDFDANNFGFYFRGDSIRIKWMTIDAGHFDFWNTLEFSRNNSGPFSSFNRVTSNVDGALGVWGGYAVRFYDEFVPFK